MIARRDHHVRIEEITDLSPSCFRLLVSCRDPVVADPGQFVMLTCAAGLDPLLRRPFSIAGIETSETGSVIELLLKDVGRGTSRLHQSVVGTHLALLGPLGNSFTLAAPASTRLALVAGGIGLPPILFAAGRLAARSGAFDFFLGAAVAAELLEVERCRRAVEPVGGEFVLTTDDGSRGEAGLVTDALSRRIGEGRKYGRILACGPNGMLQGVGRVARENGLVAELSLEEPMACGVGVCLGCVVELADGSFVPTCKEGPVFLAERLAARWCA